MADDGEGSTGTGGGSAGGRVERSTRRNYRRSLYPTSTQLQSLCLRDGLNTIVFSVEQSNWLGSKSPGKAELTARVFLFDT